MFQETLEITIDVVDPEGMPVTVSLVNGSPNKALIVDNVLIWNATNDASSHFYLKATDACQATSYINITVSLVVCQCQNNGSCVPHLNRPRGSGYYECDCVPGFTGENCDINIDDCQSYPCFRGIVNAVALCYFVIQIQGTFYSWKISCVCSIQITNQGRANSFNSKARYGENW